MYSLMYHTAKPHPGLSRYKVAKIYSKLHTQLNTLVYKPKECLVLHIISEKNVYQTSKNVARTLILLL